jgi:hypothetical protein
VVQIPGGTGPARAPLVGRHGVKLWTREVTMKLSGGCNCGQVRYELDGEPIRVGICHCETCRKESGSAFSYFGIWPRVAATLSGELGCWQSRAGGDRFCPQCGSSLFCWTDESDEIEIKLGTLDGPPTGLVPAYELWTIRREPWLACRKGAVQHARDREKSDG